MNTSTNTTGYSKASLWIHWLTAILVIALFMTHEGGRGSASQSFHVGGGALAGLFFLWRIFRRFGHGIAQKPVQNEAFNLISRLVLWGMLVTIVVICITGYLLPWSRGAPLDIFGLAIPSPFPGNRSFHELMETIHDLSGHLIIALAIIHIAGVAKHMFLDNDKSVAKRMFLPVRNGR